MDLTQTWFTLCFLDAKKGLSCNVKEVVAIFFQENYEIDSLASMVTFFERKQHFRAVMEIPSSITALKCYFLSTT